MFCPCFFEPVSLSHSEGMQRDFNSRISSYASARDRSDRSLGVPPRARGLRYQAQPVPHMFYPPVQFVAHGFCSFVGRSVQLDSAYSRPVVSHIIFSLRLL